MVSEPNPSLSGRHLKLCMEQEGKGTPLHVSRQPKDHKPREGEGAIQDACSSTEGFHLQLKKKTTTREHDRECETEGGGSISREPREDNLSIRVVIMNTEVWPWVLYLALKVSWLVSLR